MLVDNNFIQIGFEEALGVVEAIELNYPAVSMEVRYSNLSEVLVLICQFTTNVPYIGYWYGDAIPCHLTPEELEMAVDRLLIRMRHYYDIVIPLRK